MKLITDKTLISYRIAIKGELFNEISSFSFFIAELQERLKSYPLNEREIRLLYKKVVIICNLYYELAFGNYFSKQSQGFKEKIYERLVSIYSKIIFNSSIQNIDEKVSTQILIDMENILKEEITKLKNNGK